MPRLLRCLALCLLANAAGAAERVVHVYNWSDYVAAETITAFTRATGIRVVYDVYDSNEVLEAKLLAGHSGYDVIFPTAQPFAQRHIATGLYRAIEAGKLPGFAATEARILAALADVDPGHRYVAPYLWGTTGIGYNVAMVRERLGSAAPLDSWSMLFDPPTVAKLAICGVTFLDEEQEGLAAALFYLGRDPNSAEPQDLEAAQALFAAIRPYVRDFDSSQYIQLLANGDLCVAHGYSGDVLQARARAAEAGTDVAVAYTIPREGAILWIDVMAVPVDAPHPAEARALIEYLLRPEVIAPISNFVAYANANAAATTLVDAAVRGDPGIYPPAEVMARLRGSRVLPAAEQRARTRVWTRIQSGR